jgi:hypothetical protein
VDVQQISDMAMLVAFRDSVRRVDGCDACDGSLARKSNKIIQLL